MNKTFLTTNLYETTLGNFASGLMESHESVMGPEQILYSVRYSLFMMPHGASWVETLPHSESEKLNFIPGNAIDLLGWIGGDDPIFK